MVAKERGHETLICASGNCSRQHWIALSQQLPEFVQPDDSIELLSARLEP
jgi:hypothetical protein